jgi:CubicO group peptidase (beta-lactamase class C family)
MTRILPLVSAAALVFGLPCSAHGLGAPSDTVVSALGARLDSALRAAQQRGFNGVVRIEKDGQLVLAKGYGTANRERGIPFSRSTVVQIGSNTKDFTLVGLLRLQARGRLSLRDSLGRFFPTAPADKRGITLQQLAEHRGGFPIGFGDDFAAVSREEFVKTALASPLRATPGTREIYSNAGYALLAAVIEQVTGTSYDRFVRDEILAPLGLDETGFLLPRFTAERVAHGYERGQDRGSILEKPHAPDGPYWNLRGNGGMLATVDDMHAFYHALFESERLLPFAGRGDRFDPRAPVGLAGSDLVNFFLFERIPSERVEMIIATNSAEARAPMIRDELAGLLGLPRMDRGPAQAAAPPADAKPPAPSVATVVRGLVSAINGGDQAALRAFIAEHFDAGPDAPPVEQRTERFAAMHERLGTLTINAMWVDDRGAVNLSIATANEGPATLLIDVAPGSEKIRGIRVMVGG